MNRFRLRLLPAAAAVLLPCSLLPVLPAVGAAADDSTAARTFTDETLTYEVIEGGVRITAADSGLTKVIIPRDFSGYPILEIGEYAFSECGGLTSVEIQANLNAIRTGAFSECYALQTLTFSTGTVSLIEDGAFFDCEALTSFTLPDTVTEIGDYTFGYCFSLKEFTVPASLSEIPGYAFYYDEALEHVTIEEGVQTISGMSFIGCSSLKELTIPASVTSIAPYAFVSCNALERITVAEGNSSYVTDESGVLFDAAGTTLMLYPAAGAGGSYAVADGVTAIAPYAFSGASLSEITVPDSVTELGEGAFANCSDLTQFTMPSGITSIESTLFAETGLTSFTIPEGVTEIGDYAFYCCKSLTEISIPDTVTKVGGVAFFGCTGIHGITVPDSVTEISDYAFGYQYETEDPESDVILLPDFVLRGSAKSAAKAYASDNDISFKQIGIDGNMIIIAVIAVLAVLFVIVLIVSLVRRKQARTQTEEAAAAVPQPEDMTDPNYKSILDDDGDDPFERSDNSTPLSGAEREKLEAEAFPDD